MTVPFLRALVFAAATLLGVHAGFAQKSYVREDLASAVVRLEDALKKEAGTGANRVPAQLRRDGDGQLGRGNARTALDLFAGAIASDSHDWANWLGFARAAKAVEPRNWQERYTLQERSTAAAYAAYQRAPTRGDEATALALLGEVYAGQSSWRQALDSYKESLQRVDAPAVRSTYDTLRAEHGFRLSTYKVDSDGASPRVCFVFTEAPAGGKVDFAPFVSVSGVANAAVTVDGLQLCVDGLKHGEKYSFVIREGLPSSVGENLLKSANYDIYVKDRSPQVRFTGRNYVLPRTGQEGIPIVSVNSAQAEIDVYRVGDRNLLPTLRSDEFLAQMGRSSALALGREKGFKIWSGTMDTRSDLNKDVTTAFPVMDAVGRLEPGVYVMTARPPGKPRSTDTDDSDDDYGTRATQWFVVSDLGLTSFKGADGVHVFVRSLATAEAVSDVEIRLVARTPG